MSVLPSQVGTMLPLKSSEDVVRLRHAVRQAAVECAFSLVDQTKLVTAASELARNALDHGGGGEAILQVLEREGRRGVRIVFVDQGKGIANIDQALKDGFTTGSGLGLGLGGARRLCNEFDIQSQPGAGTRVTIARWK